MKNLLCRFLVFLSILSINTWISGQSINVSSYDQSSFVLKNDNFNMINVGSVSTPAFTDMDNDGLVDLLIGEYDGTINHYEQIWSDYDEFTLISSNFNNIDVGEWSSPAIVDLDGDNLLDLIIGRKNGSLYHYEQDGVNSITFILITTTFNDINEVQNEILSPYFKDIDGNDLVDLLIGKWNGTIEHYEQNSVYSYDFTLVSSLFNSIDIGYNARPVFTDVDKDGLLDLIIGEDSGEDITGDLNHYEQAAPNSLVFNLVTQSLDNIIIGSSYAPNFADIDKDGSLDMLVGRWDGNLYHYEKNKRSEIDFGSVMLGSTAQDVYSVNASDLTEDMMITCSDPFKISLSESSGYTQNLVITPTGGSINDSIYVNFEPLLVGTVDDVIIHSSSGFSINMSVAGTGCKSSLNALDFDGVDDFVDCGNPNLSILNNATVSAWIYPTALSGMIVCQGFNHGGNENGWMLAIGEDNWGSPDPGELVWASHNASTNANEGMLVPSPSAVVRLNEWQHVAATKNGTEVKLYFNGTLIHTEDLVSSSIAYNNGYDLQIGKQTTSEVYFNYRFPGKIDEVQVWNVTLSEEQIRQNMKKQLDGNEPGLAAYYVFNSTSGTILQDMSQNGNNGTLVAMDDSDWAPSDAMIYTPAALDATSQTETSFTSNWEINYTADKYYLDVANDSLFTSFVEGYENKEISNYLILSEELSNLSPSNYFYYRIRAYNQITNQTSEYSNTIKTRTLYFPPAPAAVSADSIQYNRFRAKWLSVPLVAGYRIDVDDDIDFSSPLPGYDDLDVGNVLNLTIDGLDIGITYYYRVRAYTIYEVSPNSNVISVNIPYFYDTDSGLQGISQGSADWGDFDNDGDLDILLTGHTGSIAISKIYRNDSGMFSDINAGLDPVYNSSADWGDYDNDGDLDIALTGYSGSERISKIFRNDSGTFTDINAGFQGVEEGSIAWSDYDNDGDIDILLTGSYIDGSWKYTSKIYRNDSGTFTEINTGLPGVSNGCSEWGDYDNDGDLDIILTGRNYSGSWNYISEVYRNDSGIFTGINAGFTGVYESSVAWGDYDSDGDIDLLITGRDESYNELSRIYRNDSGIFTNINAGLIGLNISSGKWGDFDNDGDLDILLSGSDPSSNKTTRIYRNDSGSFIYDQFAGLDRLTSGSAVWGDYDNDGDLDIMLFGSASLGIISKIYENKFAPANIKPDPPSNLSVTENGSVITFKWSRSSDAETPRNGLSYNLYVGTTSLNGEVQESMSDKTNGYRKIVSFGNACQDTTWTIRNLPEDRYFWSVQAIDHSFTGSEFAPEQQIIIGLVEPVNLATTIIGSDLQLSWDAAPGATSYKIYSSDDPYGTFAEDAGGTLVGETWTVPLTEAKKFYYVTASDSAKTSGEIFVNPK